MHVKSENYNSCLTVVYIFVMLLLASSISQIPINNSTNRQDNIPVSKPTGSIILFITVLFKVSEQNSSFFWSLVNQAMGNGKFIHNEFTKHTNK